MSSGSTVYKVPMKVKVVHMLLAFIVIFLFAVFFAPKMGLPGVIGSVIGASLIAFPKMTLSEDAITIKARIVKARVFPIAEGQFSIDTITGLKAMVLGVSSKKKVLNYKKNGSDKAVMVAANYPDEIMEEVFNRLPDHAKIK